MRLAPEDNGRALIYVRFCGSTHSRKKEWLSAALSARHAGSEFGGPGTDGNVAIIAFGGLTEIIRALKTFSSRRINETGHAFRWQRSFYDRIIRNDAALRRIRTYIRENLMRWATDSHGHLTKEEIDVNAMDLDSGNADVMASPPVVVGAGFKPAPTTTTTHTTDPTAIGDTIGTNARNLIPDQPSATPSYWCTWGAQNYAVDAETYKQAIGIGGHAFPARALTEQRLFGPDGWAVSAYEKIRRDLMVMFDVGWDVAVEETNATFGESLGQVAVDAGKFPSCAGDRASAFAALQGLCHRAGWKGAGLWIHASPSPRCYSGDMNDLPGQEAFWRERLCACASAAIPYWKVDYGRIGQSIPFRRWLTGMGREHAPGIIIEHARSQSPFNDVPGCPYDDPGCSGEFTFAGWGGGGPLRHSSELLGFCDVLRSYDISAHLSIATTLSRVAGLLEATPASAGLGLINCEDEPYLGAGLACSIGIMRHPQWQDFGGDEYDPLQLRRRIDEVVRAVRWTRIAPALGVGRTAVDVDAKQLADSWHMRKGDTWAHWVHGKDVIQRAPARIARGLPLPIVRCEEDAPFVTATRHPNGATAVAVLPRTLGIQGITHPSAHIAVDIAQPGAPIGLFGRVASLTLRGVFPSGARWLAQDLAGDRAEEITGSVRMTQDGVQVDGEVLARVGLSAATAGDLSDPGLVMQMIRGTI